MLDPPTGFCRGCGRTIEEISAWAAMPEAERTALLARLPERLAVLAASVARRG